MFFLACVTKKEDTAAIAARNIELCEQAREGFYEYIRELNETVVDRTCETHNDCQESDCRNMCGGCGGVLANTETYDLAWDLLKDYEEEHCQACENYPYPEPEEPDAEPVSEPPWCTEGICE